MNVQFSGQYEKFQILNTKAMVENAEVPDFSRTPTNQIFAVLFVARKILVSLRVIAEGILSR